jgi:hypothetical protein
MTRLFNSVGASVLAMFVASASTRAADLRLLAHMFESVCVGSQLQRDVIEKLMSSPHISGIEDGAEALKIPTENLTLLSPLNKSGWHVNVGNEDLKIFYAERNYGQRIARSCSIASEVTLPDMMVEIEASYHVKKVIDERRGSGRLVVYSVDLTGAQGSLAISMQRVSGLEPTTISLSEMHQ